MAAASAIPSDQAFVKVTRKGNVEPIVYFFADGRSSCIETSLQGVTAQDIATSLGFDRIVGQSRPYTRHEMQIFRSARNARLSREAEEQAENDRLAREAQQEKWAAYNLQLEAEMDRQEAEIRARVLPTTAAEKQYHKKCFACQSVAAYKSDKAQHCSICKTPNRLETVYF